MERIVPRFVCEPFERYVVVRRYDRRRVQYWTGRTWCRCLRAARLYHDMQDVNEVIHRFQPPPLFD